MGMVQSVQDFSVSTQAYIAQVSGLLYTLRRPCWFIFDSNATEIKAFTCN